MRHAQLLAAVFAAGLACTTTPPPATAELTAAPSAVSTGATVGTPASATITLSTTAATAITVTAVAIEPAGPWSVATGAPITVPAKGSTTLELSYAPASAGIHDATLKITHSGKNSPLSIPLSGTATAAGAAVLSLDPATVTLATEPGTPKQGTFKVKNTGNAAANLTGYTIAPTGSPWTTTATGTLSVAANGERTITVNYAPTAEGTHDATLTIAHNAGGAALVVTLHGTAATAAADALTADPASVDATAPVGGSRTGSVTVSNGSGASVDITAIAVAPAGPWTTTTTPTVTIADGADASIDLVYAPTAVGTHDATLTLTHTGAGSPLTVPLHGTAATASAGDLCSAPVAVDLAAQAEVEQAGDLSASTSSLGWTDAQCTDTALPGGGLYSGGAYDGGELFYAVSLPAQSVLQVETTSDDLDLDIGLFAYAGSPACPGFATLACAAAADGSSADEGFTVRACGNSASTLMVVVAAYSPDDVGAGTFNIRFRRGACDQELEPNDDPGHATELVLGTAMKARIDDPAEHADTGVGDVDVFSFAAVPGIVTAKVEADDVQVGLVAPFLELSDPFGSFSRAGKNPAGGNSYAREFFIPEAGTYHLAVAHAPNLDADPVGGLDTFKYKVTVTQSADFSTGTPAATVISDTDTVTAGTQFAGAYALTADSNGVYKLGLYALPNALVDPDAGALFRAWTANEKQADPSLWIWDEGATAVSGAGDDNFPGGGELHNGRDAYVVTQLEAGVDYLLIVDFQAQTAAGASLNLAFRNVAFFDEAAGDTPADAPTATGAKGNIDNRIEQEEIFFTGSLDGAATVPDIADVWRVNIHPGYVYDLDLMFTDLPADATVEVLRNNPRSTTAVPLAPISLSDNAFAESFTFPFIGASGPPATTAAASSAGGNFHFIRVALADGSTDAGDYLIALTRHRCPPTDFAAPIAGDVALNEIFPARSGHGFDANHDGVADGSDQFVETVNISSHRVDLGGAMLAADTSSTPKTTYYGFACGATLPSGSAAVVFQGGAINGDPVVANRSTFGYAPFLDSLRDGISTVVNSASADNVYFIARDGTTALHQVATPCPGGTADPDCKQSLTQDDRTALPTTTGAFVFHTTLAAGVKASPGTRVNGTAFNRTAAATDQCASAPTIVAGLYTGLSTAALTNDYECAAAPSGFAETGKNAFLKLHLDAGQTLRARARGTAAPADANAYDLALALTTDCASNDACVAAEDQAGGGGAETLFYTAAAAGDYVLVVDSDASKEGDGAFTLEVDILAP